MTRFRTRPTFREQRAQSVATLRNMGGGELPPELAAAEERTRPKEKRQRGPVNADMSEAGVMREVKELLAVHPNVLFAVRQNSGAASYEAVSGKFAPVRFYQIVRTPVEMTIVDWWGFISVSDIKKIWYIPFALECKRRDWKLINSDRRANDQDSFLRMIRAIGGRAGFARSAEEARKILEGS